MKGYQIEDRLYIFPQTVDVIPEVEDVDVIYVQHETVKAWKEANSDVADKIKGYNFLTITASPKEWAGHTDDDIEPAPETYTFTVYITGTDEPIYTNSYEADAEVDYTFNTYFPSDSTQTFYTYIDPEGLDYAFNPGSEYFDEETQQTITDYATISFTMPAAAVTFTVTQINLYEVNVDDEYVTSYVEGNEVNITLDGPMDSISPNDLEYTYDSETGGLSFTMPAETVNIYTTQQATTYTLTLEGTYSDGGQMVVTIDGDQAEGESPYTVPEGATVNFQNTQGADGDFEWDPQLTDEGGYHYIVMPAEDVTITINYTGGGSGPS